MRAYSRPGLFVVGALLLLVRVPVTSGSTRHQPIDPRDRDAVLALIKAVDLAQAADAASADVLAWDCHILKAGEHAAYVPFRLTLNAADSGKATTLYVRAVSRRDGRRVADERSSLRDWLIQG